ncbi:C39 family peptidase [Mycolicibacterium sp. S2-37]|uniref:C39 family peptidase n=1 Tax=Mycolicibacterium sp. S2-37 TaxID=2810297 RepID=UPI001A946211|nr:C39 family peptidase [Mycolicibacterium sp. S2-37]MBO0681116.1 C39 family peptidase [Mycolicibacterium sp. S2-37]
MAAADTAKSGVSTGTSSTASSAESAPSESSSGTRTQITPASRGVRAASENDDRRIAVATESAPDRVERRAAAGARQPQATSQGSDRDPKQSLSGMSADLARAHAGVEAAPSSAVVAMPAAGVHGNPEANKKYLRQQGNCPTCVLMAVASVVGQLTGILPENEEIITRATTTRSDTARGEMIYQPGGTGQNGKHYGVTYVDAVKLLDSYGIDAVVSEYTKNQGDRALKELTAALDDRGSVIVSIHGQTMYDALFGWDHSPRPPGIKSGNHAVSVTGVDENRRLVFINDSNLKTGAQPIPLDLFLEVWRTSAYTTVIARPRQAAAAPQSAVAA